MLALLEYFPSIQALTNSNPKGSSKVMNDLRAQYGFEITPISSAALRKAITRLRNGGVVAIANDVPVANGDDLVFFGERCDLPVGHARLAQMTDAQMVVGASFQLGDGLYQAKAKIVPPPVSSASKSQKIQQWAQDALTATEGFIRQKPDEWLMPHPLWSCAG
jgi:lauroyl/myristoyl acyltransferase